MRKRRNALWVGAGAVVLLGLAVWIGLVFGREGSGEASDQSQVISVMISLWVLLLASLRQLLKALKGGPMMTQGDDARRVLLGQVLSQWRDEIIVRQLDHPARLAVHFDPVSVPGVEGISGRADDVDALAAAFGALPVRRLVILGEGGSGKTTLAVLLLRSLLDDARDGAPIPVLLPVSDWVPSRDRFADWLTSRLTEGYPALSAQEFGPHMPRDLVTGQAILPILDGLDDLPLDRRREALRALNNGLNQGDPYILTCRTVEYAEAAVPAARASVITPRPVDPAESRAFLDRCLADYPGHPSWDAFLDDATSRPTGAAAQVLTTPLWLWLLRKVYIETGRSPDELLAFSTAEEITDHLLDHLVESLIAANEPDPVNPVRPRHRWQADDANRWLGELAQQLDGRRDLTWWHLQERSVQRLVALGSALAVALLGGLVGGFVFTLTLTFSGTSHWLSALATGLIAGAVFGLAHGLTVGLTTLPGKPPAYASLRLRGRFKPLLRQMAIGLALGPPSGLLLALFLVPFTGWGTGLLSGMLLGIAMGIAGGVVDWVRVSLPSDDPETPPVTLRRDTILSTVRIFTVVLAVAPVLGIIGALVADRTDWDTGTQIVATSLSALVLGLFLGFSGCLKFGTTTETGSRIAPKILYARFQLQASTTYRMTVLTYALRGRLPLRLMPFLEDAHRLGLVRQIGPVYQFRHADLQDRLAQTSRGTVT
ncbi:NACHT domain-containing protein [Actinocorallia lasiicapitis]